MYINTYILICTKIHTHTNIHTSMGRKVQDMLVHVQERWGNVEARSHTENMEKHVFVTY